MRMPMIWRDDDILWKASTLEQLLRVDDLLKQYRQPHTIAILAESLTPAIANVIVERRMIPQLHAWQHDDLSVDAKARGELAQAITKIEELCGRRPMVLYPPWNRTSPALEAVARELGLIVSSVKLSLEQYIRADGDVDCETINFHYWADEDVAQLEPALRIATRGLL